jgi:D-galactose 1-dehydrogenase
MAEIRIGIIGLGKIAHDQHAPAIAASSAFALAGAVTRGTAPLAEVPVYGDYRQMLETGSTR